VVNGLQQKQMIGVRYSETFKMKEEVICREKQIKNWKSRKMI
jgi:predicted GIY-YIG superfamily endonuclease